MRTKWWVLSMVAVIAVAGVLALRRKPVPPPPARNAAPAATEAPNVVTIEGRIRPQHILGVAAGVPGLIEAFLVEPGQDVFEGQVLARIGSQGLESAQESAVNALEHAREQVIRAESALAGARLELSRAEADAQRSQMALDRAQKVFQRQQTLHSQGATPRLTFEKAQADYEAALKDYEIMSNAARAGREQVSAAQKNADSARRVVEENRSALEVAQDNLAGSEVRSPVEGYVVSHEGEVGRSAEEAGNRFFTIATDLYALEVVLEPKADLLKRIIPGMPATVLLLDLGAAAFEGRVKEIDDKANQVVVEFASTNPAVKPGMVAHVRFQFQ